MANVKIVNVKQIQSEPVFDISVEDAHHYILGNGVITHNSGAKYAADTIVFLSKKKDRDADKEVVGNIVTARMVKSRLTKEESRVDTRILFDGGLDRYYGLLEYGEAAGMIKRVGNKYEFPNGVKAFEKAILTQPEQFFTQEFLTQLNPFIEQQFSYSSTTDALDVSDMTEVEE